MDLQGWVDAKFNETIVAPPLQLSPVIPALYRRHSRERGNPEGSPREIKYEQQPADPFSLHGLAGVGFDFGSFSRCWNLGDAGDGEPSQPSEIKYELKPADPFSLYGRRLG